MNPIEIEDDIRALEATGVACKGNPSFVPAHGSAQPWNKYPDTKPEQDGWYLVWCVAGLILETDTVADYEPHFEQAYWTGKIDDWESASSCAPLADGCYVTHWTHVNAPNEKAV